MEANGGDHVQADKPTKQPAAQRAYHHVKSLLLDGAVKPGEMLSEGDIATSLGISRTPVREAFTRLQSEGWLRLYPRRGALVVPVDPNQTRDLVDARVLLESESVRTVVHKAETTDRTGVLQRLTDDLESILSQQREALDAQDLAAFSQTDLAFHRAIIEASGNSIYVRFQDAIADQETRMSVRSLWRSPEAARRVVSQHAELLTAVGHKDVDAFRAALRHHLMDIHSDLIT
jgi:DNA-binding GntR family transcriptional regulator